MTAHAHAFDLHLLTLQEQFRHGMFRDAVTNGPALQTQELPQYRFRLQFHAADSLLSAADRKPAIRYKGIVRHLVVVYIMHYIFHAHFFPDTENLSYPDILQQAFFP